MKWHGDEFFRMLEEHNRKTLELAAIHLKNKVKEKLSTPYPPASNPEDYPHRRDGELRRSVAHEVVGHVARVGTNKVYGRHLEMGTSRMKKRPFLRPTLANQRRQLRRIMTRPMNR